MDVKKLVGINLKINNVFEAALPYRWAFQGEDLAPKEGLGKKMVVFFGNDAATLYKMGVDSALYVERCNRCLDYLRREFKDCALYYKPHPADNKERTTLDLRGFGSLDDKINAELFLLQNRDRIKAVFSVGSAANYSAHNMGVNSYVFYKCFASIYDPELSRPLDEFFHDMPNHFFIKDFDEKIVEDAPALKRDDLLESFFKRKLNENQGKIWLSVFTTEHIVILIALANLIRALSPARKIGLIISHHYYWNLIDGEYFTKYFDEIVVFPRINYSLRPTKLCEAVKTAKQIKNLKISSGDILISVSQTGFVENCFMSYFKNNLRIGLVADKDFNLFYNSRNTVYRENDNFRFSKASWFFNNFFEPMLGLYRSLFMFYGRGGGSFIIRYEKPLNEVFDEVILLGAQSK